MTHLIMKMLISKETKSHLAKLGLYQMVGGAIGIFMILWAIYKNGQLTVFAVLICLFIIPFFSYSIYCGTLCIKANKNALRYSLINQIFQVVGFAMMGFAFKYVAGFYFTLGLNLTESINFNLDAGISKFAFNFNRESERLEIDFNLIAFALIYWIDKLIKEAKEDTEIREVLSIGEIESTFTKIDPT